jgi:hypothetical protein
MMSPHPLRSGGGAAKSCFNWSGNSVAFCPAWSIPCSALVSDLAGPADAWTRRRYSHLNLNLLALVEQIGVDARRAVAALGGRERLARPGFGRLRTAAIRSPEQTGDL